MAIVVAGLALNPSAKILFQAGAEPPVFNVEAPIPGASLMHSVVSAERFPEAHRFLCGALLHRGDVNLDPACVLQLRELGLLTDASRLPRSVEYHLERSAHAPDASVLVAPELLATLTIPTAWQGLPLGLVGHHHDSVWAPVLVAAELPVGQPVGQPGNGAPIHVQTQIQAQTQARLGLDPDCVFQQFAQEGFAVLANLLPDSHVQELGRYFAALAAEGYLHRFSERGQDRYVTHDHPVANFWHAQLVPRISALAGKRVKPSYTFVTVYAEGGELPWHTDRDPCEYTLSLLLDYAPLTHDGVSPWPLRIRRRDASTADISQRIGEALLFKGRELTHCREVLPSGHRSVSALFHFVDHDYAGPLL